MYEWRGAYRIFVGNLSERDYFEQQGLDERIVLKWISQEVGWGIWTGFIWLRIETGGGLL
jgi:hypothetical protein